MGKSRSKGKVVNDRLHSVDNILIMVNDMQKTFFITSNLRKSPKNAPEKYQR